MDIFVKDIIPNAFSEEQAKILKNEIEQALRSDVVVNIDFSGIKRYTTLFFNFSVTKFIDILGPEKFEQRIKLMNLSNLGESTFNNSKENALTKYPDNKYDELIKIIKEPNE